MNNSKVVIYGYIYIVTDLLNKKNLPHPFYVGQKIGKFRANYFGSGKIIKNVINRYSSNNFAVKLIAYASTKKELNDLERFWIKRIDCIWPKGYNISPGGDGGKVYKVHPMKGKHHTKKQCDKWSLERSGKNNPSFGKTGIKNTNFRTRRMYSKQLNKQKQVKTKDIKQYLQHGWDFGVSPKTILLMQKASHHRSGNKNPFFGKHHLKKSKRIISKKVSAYRTGKKHSMKTTKFLRKINLGNKNPVYGKHWKLSIETKNNMKKAQQIRRSTERKT